MKKDEFLYEIMDEVTVEEAEMLDRLVAREEKSFFGCLGRKEKKEWKKMKSLTMDKINGQMKEERISKVSLFGRRRMVLLAAVLVMMLGIATVAKEKDWDIEMAERIGFSGAMENLEGGYVRIDKSVTKDDITITAVQSIGSQNCQWIQFDTNVPWETGEEGYYVFEDMSIDITTKRGKNIGYGAGLYSYDNNGYVSFMLDVSGYEKINRANMHISLGRLKQYENEYLEGGIGKGIYNLIAFVRNVLMALEKKELGNNVMFVMNLPWRGVARMSGVLSDEQVLALIDMMNHKKGGFRRFLNHTFRK